MCLLRCGAHIAQWALFIVNFLLSIVGLAIIGIGIYALIEVNKINGAAGSGIGAAPVFIIVVGCIFTAIFFCGCCGAFYRNKCLLITYSIITILLASVSVYAAVNVFETKSLVKDTVNELLAGGFESASNQEILGYVEVYLGCCGTTGPEFYSNSTLPVTCCPHNLQNLHQNSSSISTTTSSGISLDPDFGDSLANCSVSNAYTTGCTEIFTAYILNILNITGNVLIWIIIIEYLSAFFAIFLTCYSGRK